MAEKKNCKTEVKVEEVLKPVFSKYYDKEDAYKNLDRVNEWINNCDTKTSILIAFVAAIIAIFAQSIGSVSYIVEFFNFNEFNAWIIIKFILISCLLVSFTVLLFITIRNIYIVLIGKILFNKSKEKYLTEEEKTKRSKKGSLLFFQTIADFKLEDFQQREKEISEEEFFDDISTQIFFNSKRCTEKFTHYNMALKFSIILFSNVLLLLVFSLV